MRLTEISFNDRTSLAVWIESRQGWILASDLLKDYGQDFSDVSVTRLLTDCKSKDGNLVSLGDAIVNYENDKRNGLCVYNPGVNCEYDKLFFHPQKVLCVGLNYADHAREFGDALPNEPVVFNKAPSALSFSGAPIVLPRQSKRVDYEGELVVVIGKDGRDIPEERAMDYVVGYCCGNDVSARDWQKEKPTGQWFLGKSFDSFAPVGPCFVTADEVGDPNNLKIETRLNGRVMQSSNTNCFVFRVSRLISYLSQVMTLRIGDLVFTGTPNGVGDARKPPVYLKRGDVIEVEIEKIGTLSNPVY